MFPPPSMASCSNTITRTSTICPTSALQAGPDGTRVFPGACFIRTDQLDGETDWKLKVAVGCTQRLPAVGVRRADSLPAH